MNIEHFLDLDKYDAADLSEDLTQRLFDGVLTDREAERLLEIWKNFPPAKDLAAANDRIDALFRFIRDRQTLLSPERLYRLQSKYVSRYGESELHESGSDESGLSASRNVGNQEPTPDFECMIQLAANSPSLPMEKKEPVPKKNELQVKHQRSTTIPAPQNNRVLLRFPLLVSLLIVVFIVYDSFFSRPSYDPAFSTSSHSQAIAVMTDTASVQWNEVPAFKLGEPIQGGRLSLKTGYVELLLFNGNRVILEGPADVSLLSPNRLFCRSGKISASVPPSGVGLEIQTPRTTVVDLGTAFWLDVSATKDVVRVVEGAVRIDETDRENKTESFLLRKGDGRETLSGQPGRSLEPVASEVFGFVSTALMKKLSAACPDHTTRRQAVRVQRSDVPALCLDFSDLSGGFKRFGGEIVDGSAEAIKAMRFTGKSDHVRIDDSRQWDSLTLTCRVRLDELDSFTFNPLLAADLSTIGGIIWQIAPDGCLGFGFRSQKKRNVDMYFSPIVVEPARVGQWMHLALVVDRRQGTVSHYLDGDLVALLRFNEARPINLKNALVGNRRLKTSPALRFHGLIEDFRVYDRPLVPEEVYNLSHDVSPHKISAKK